MNDVFVVVSLCDNTLYVSIDPNDVGSFIATSKKLPSGVVSGTQITDVRAFSNLLLDSIKSLCGRIPKNASLHFLVEPQDSFLRFVMTKKSGENMQQQIKLDLGESFASDLYYSCQKIAPFVFQFVGIKKDDLEKYLEVARIVEIPIKGVIPWAMLLPKYVSKNIPCAFLVKRNEKRAVILSELNGVYFSQVYATDKSIERLRELGQKSAMYEESRPVSRIFTVDCGQFSLDPDYMVEELMNGDEYGKWPDHKLHILYENVSTQNLREHFFASQTNLLNSLPVPVPVASQKPLALVYAGAAVGVLLVSGLLIGGFFAIKDSDQASQVLSGDTVNVLEEVKETSEASQPAVPFEESKPEKELSRGDLKIRVENGSGINGEAAKTKEYLEPLGYSVVSIGTAAQNRQDTLAVMKKSKDEYKTLLENDLGERFGLVFDENLDESAEYDVLIVVGSPLESNPQL
ncbi:LytR C-terminal domain-containing protein [candidate division WWE3 bacterium]|nr:LytR C-terminal domain-containing protein [candidate division WWE3 bacterium]